MNTPARELSPMDRYKSVLKSHSLKATPQRLAVHEAMLSLGHACADQVSDWIRDHGHTPVAVASVYNILSQMALLGVYDHRMSSNNKMYFDVNTFKHIHLYDTQNNEYKDLMDDELIALVESRTKGRKYKGYKIDGVDIQIICHPNNRKTTLLR